VVGDRRLKQTGWVRCGARSAIHDATTLPALRGAAGRSRRARQCQFRGDARRRGSHEVGAVGGHTQPSQFSTAARRALGAGRPCRWLVAGPRTRASLSLALLCTSCIATPLRVRPCPSGGTTRATTADARPSWRRKPPVQAAVGAPELREARQGSFGYPRGRRFGPSRDEFFGRRLEIGLTRHMARGMPSGSSGQASFGGRSARSRDVERSISLSSPLLSAPLRSSPIVGKARLHKPVTGKNLELGCAVQTPAIPAIPAPWRSTCDLGAPERRGSDEGPLPLKVRART
jgi:hypothetical protein